MATVTEKAAEKSTEAVAEVAENVAEQATELAKASRRLSNRELAFALSGFAAGLVGGGLVGWVVLNKRLSVKYDKLAGEKIEEEFDRLKEHFDNKKIALQEQAMKTKPVEAIVAEQGYGVDDPPIIKTIPGDINTGPAPTRNIFREQMEAQTTGPQPPDPKERPSTEEGWSYPEELERRRGLAKGIPYVIHEDEWNEVGYSTTTMTFYEEDSVLTDERDKIVDDAVMVLGTEFLTRFGDGSEDPNTVFVRNDTLAIDVEVTRDPGSYAEIVHGYRNGPEIEEMRQRNKARFVDDDEQAD